MGNEQSALPGMGGQGSLGRGQQGNQGQGQGQDNNKKQPEKKKWEVGHLLYALLQS